VPILAVATALLLILAVVMTGLFVVKNNDLESTQKDLAASKSQVARQQATIKENEAKISGLQGEVTKTKSDLAAAQQELSGVKSRLGNTQAEKQVVEQCLRLVFQFIEALADQDRARANALVAQLRAPCDAAERIIS